MPSRHLLSCRPPVRGGVCLVVAVLLASTAGAQEFPGPPDMPDAPEGGETAPEARPEAPAVEIHWQATYDEARKLATKAKVPLLLDIGTESCYWCKQLDIRTFTDPAVARLLNTRFIALKINARDPANIHLVQALRIQSYPTLVFAGHDGRILGFQEGFVDAAELKGKLLRILALATAPEWMKRDFQDAKEQIKKEQYARAWALLANVVRDGRTRPTQVEARKLIAEIETKANAELTRAREAAKGGDPPTARAEVEKMVATFEGTPAAREGKRFLFALEAQAKAKEESRRKKAKEWLSEARADFGRQRFHCCLDRCELLVEEFRDLPEAKEARQLIEDITGNPEWTRKACQQLGDRLSKLYLAQAETWLKKGQPQQAIFYLERILRNFPEGQHAEQAKGRLLAIQGSPKGETDE